jgi:hypothetical protein
LYDRFLRHRKLVQAELQPKPFYFKEKKSEVERKAAIGKQETKTRIMDNTP